MRRAAPCGLLLLFAGCGGSDPPRMNAVLITLDTTRYDALGCLGGRPGITPSLDNLAAESVVYEAARTVAPLTLPAHASMLTGLYPPRHTVRDNALTPLPEAADTIAERARAGGYQTGAVIATRVLGDVYGLSQGFDDYDAPGNEDVERTRQFAERNAADVTASALAWLGERDRERPFLLWVHYFDPHRPFARDGPYLERAGGNPYLADVVMMDDGIGDLLDGLRADHDFENTLVIVVGDHGEGLGDHGEATHSAFVYDSTLRVPLMVRHPDGHRAGERSQEIVSVADVFPTLIEALGLGGPGDVDGTSLYRRTVDPERGVYFESFYGHIYYHWSPMAGWVDAKGKYVHSSEPELYDPRSDPRESIDLAKERAAEVERYRRALARLGARTSLEPAGVKVDSAMIAELQKLGYSGGGWVGDLPGLLDESDQPAPHARAAELDLLFRAWNATARDDVEAAVDAFRQVLLFNPENHEALSMLGLHLLDAGRPEEALEPLERFGQIGPTWTRTWQGLARALDAVGRTDEALTWFDRALWIEPEDEVMLEKVIEILRREGRTAEAIPYLRRLLEAREKD
ncbi:MAG: sulfatase-like hydrolase/transferase [Planctomycetota bacterium]|nr:sulfatase-like hydrolase/transferase [Planctomycetota bacterium]